MMTPEELIEHYQHSHKNKTFSKGTALLKHIPEIARLSRLLNCVNALDYGCGKAWFWTECTHWKAILDDQIQSVKLYDPGLAEFSLIPEGRYDLVVCTDVLEHIHPDQTDDFLKTLFLYTRRVLFINVSTKPATKKFPDGTNLHINLRSRTQWEKKIMEIRSWYGEKYKSFPAVVVRYDEEIGS